MGERSVADVQIEINDLPLPPIERSSVGKVTVSHNRDQYSSFSISLQVRGWDFKGMPLLDDELFAIGMRVDIALGYRGDPLQPVISGEIANIEAEFDIHEPPVVTLTGYDFGWRLAHATAIEAYADMTDSQIATQIIEGRNHLKANSKDTLTRHERVTQNNITDWDFLVTRAKLNGYEVSVDGRTVYFGPPQAAREIIPMQFGDQLVGFSPSITGGELYGSAEVYGVDLTQSQKENQEFMVSAGTTRFAGTLPSDQFNQRVHRIIRGPRNQAQAAQQAQNLVAALASSSVSASGRCRGFVSLRAGDTLAISGVGERFQGRYQVSAVTHSFAPQEGLSTNFSVEGSSA